jgi:hypothetical protein
MEVLLNSVVEALSGLDVESLGDEVLEILKHVDLIPNIL